MQMDGFLTLKGGNVELVGAPETIFVLPIGHVVSSKGEFDVDEESYKAMKAQIAKRGVDLVVDYEHQTLKGCEAPAAGWVKELKLEDVRAVLADMSRKGHTAEIRALLQKYGAAKLSGVDPANYKALLKDVEGLDHA